MISILSNLTGWSYQKVLKPILFTQDPEKIHDLFIKIGHALGKSAPLKQAIKVCWAGQAPQLVRHLNGISFPNPVGLAAGFDYNGQLTQILPAVGFGFQTIGTVTLLPYDGNAIPRLTRLTQSQALIVNKGLKNRGVKAIIHDLSQNNFLIPTGLSVASTNCAYTNEKAQIQDIVECFSELEKAKLGHAYYELNISCPNTFGGEPFTTPTKLERLLGAIDRLKIKRPIYAKLPIDQNEAESLEILAIIAEHRIAGIIAGNLTKNHHNSAVTVTDRKLWANLRGNVSGRPTFALSNRLIALTKKRYGQRFTIIGTGGIFSPADAITKMRLGADLVQLITGMIYQGPQLVGQMTKEVEFTKQK